MGPWQPVASAQKFKLPPCTFLNSESRDFKDKNTRPGLNILPRGRSANEFRGAHRFPFSGAQEYTGSCFGGFLQRNE